MAKTDTGFLARALSTSSRAAMDDELPPPCESPHVWLRLRGFWVTAEEAAGQEHCAPYIPELLDGACSFPGCVLKEKHSGLHEFDAAVLSNPTPKRKAGVPTKFIHVPDEPVVKRQCSHSSPTAAPRANKPKAVSPKRPPMAAALPPRPAAPVSARPLPTLPSRPPSLESSWPDTWPDVRKTVMAKPVENHSKKKEEGSASGSSPRRTPSAGPEADGQDAASSPPIDPELDTESFEEMADLLLGAPEGGDGPKVGDKGAASDEICETVSEAPGIRVYVKMHGWWETVDTLRRNRLWALEGMCNFPGCPLADRHSGPHLFDDEAAALHK